MSNSSMPDASDSLAANSQIEQSVRGNQNQTIGQVLGGMVVYGQVIYNNPPVEPDSSAVQTKASEIGPNPYKGLLAFQETDGDRFFGRDQQIKDLWEKFRSLHEHEFAIRVLPIYGPSGSGKSSLARAGLIPELARRPLPGRDRARVAVLVPGSHPLEALATVLARIATNDLTPVAKTREFATELAQANSEGVYDGLRRIADALPEIAISPLIVLVDQFEEIYSYEPKEESQEGKAKREKFIAARQALIENLLCAGADRSRYVSVILTMRSDFLGETQKHPTLNQLFSTQGFLVPTMDEAALREAIAKPAELAGHPLYEATINLLVNEALGREGALPLLQFALNRIWKGLIQGIEAAVTLKQIGGVGGALAGEAQRIFDDLSAEEQEIARRVFLELVQLGEGTRDTRRRIALARLVSSKDNPEHVKQVIGRFAARDVRLITLSSSPEADDTAEVTHEALFDHWRLLTQWLDENRDHLRRKRKIEADAEDWLVNKKSKGYLLQGRQLTDAKIFQQEHGQNLALSKLAEDFIRESFRQRWINGLKVASLIVIPIVSIAIPIEGYLRQESIRKNLEIYRSGVGGSSARTAMQVLTEGCFKQQEYSWIPKYLADRLFGNCERLSLNHPVEPTDGSIRKFEYSISCGKVNSTSPKPIAGILLSGGAEGEKVGEDAATRWFLKRANGGDYLVLRFGGIGKQADWICDNYRDLVSSAAELSINSLEAANDPKVIQIIRDAEAIIIAGGDRKEYENYWIGSNVQTTVNYLINQKKIPISGTSAGMAILGEYYYTPAHEEVLSSEILDNPFHPNTKNIYRSDFIEIPFLKSVITDTHLDRLFPSIDPENRYGRIFSLLARFVHDNNNQLPIYGIGLEEGAFVAIDEKGIAKVFGNGTNLGQDAYFLQTNGIVPEEIKPGFPLIWNNNGQAVKVYKISGDPEGNGEFDLNNWSTASGGSWEYWFTSGGASGFKRKPIQSQ